MTKKLIILLFAFSLIFTLASANDTQTLKLEAEDIYSASAGEAVTVNISVKDNPGIAVLAFDVEYDTNSVSLKSVAHSDEVFKKNNFTAGDLSKNPYKVLAFNANGNLTADGKLLSMNFFIKEDCPGGVYEINLTNIECYTLDEEEIACDAKAITIEVKGQEKEENNSSDILPDNPESLPEENPEDNPENITPDIPQDSSSGNSSVGSNSVVTQTTPSTSTSSGKGGKTNTQTKKENKDNPADKKPYIVQNSIILTIGKKDANVFGNNKTNDVAPILRNSRTMLPARFVAEGLGANVLWFENERKVLITKDKTEIIICIDSEKAYVNGKEEILDSPAFIENSRTYTPLRFVAEKLGAKVYWEADTQNVIIEKISMQ